MKSDLVSSGSVILSGSHAVQSLNLVTNEDFDMRGLVSKWHNFIPRDLLEKFMLQIVILKEVTGRGLQIKWMVARMYWKKSKMLEWPSQN
jgi:hypothetical protein